MNVLPEHLSGLWFPLRNMAASTEQRKIILIVFIAIFCFSIITDGDKIGVNYGTNGDNLPPVDQVVTLMKKNNFGKVRIFTANGDALKAFTNSGIDVIVGVGNHELQAISSSQDSANSWVNDNIVPFYPATNIKYIAVGNKVLDATPYASYLVPAMKNIQTAIQKANLQNNIKVSTTHSFGAIHGFPPPSTGAFKDEVKSTMNQILKFLLDNGGPFMANVYPYFTYARHTNNVSLDYSLFKSASTVLQDGNNSYSNLFDALVDTFLSAMEDLGYPKVPIIVTESGWPSAGADQATVENAEAYNNNLIRHVLSNAGTPKRPGTTIETYICALFNEDKKTGDETERHFGLFNPDQSPAYSVINRSDNDGIGVNYGMMGDNLPSADEAVALMKNNNMGKVRIFQADRDALKTFAKSGIKVTVGIGNHELPAISSSQDSANDWVNDNIVPYYPATNITYIAVGNEVLSGTQYVSYLVPAMSNIQTAIRNANLQKKIKVSTIHAMSVITGNSFRLSKHGGLMDDVKDTMSSLFNFLIAHNSAPSQGTFRDDVKDTMSSILKFLSYNGAPFMANVYPYFSYTSSRDSIDLDYALFKSTSSMVDGDMRYNNLFDAMVDTLLTAMEALGYSNISLVITETGWPSAGDDVATVENAQTYNNNLIRHVLSNAGTPKRPGKRIVTYISALFNEDKKPGDETERHFGLFTPDKNPVYEVFFYS